MVQTKKRDFRSFVKSVWFFPALLLVALVILTAFRISGSSVGMFYTYLYGNTKDKSLIAGQPQAIRSDEWEVNTPFTVSQVKDGFPRINKDVGNGEDMSVDLDVPYIDWSMVFKPQNLIFFVLPVAYAFAFKWWLLGVILMLSCYFLSLTLLPRRYLLASLLSISLFFSPLIQWWYQSETILTVAYALLIAAIGYRLLNTSLNKKKSLWLSAALTYALTCFAIFLYIPYLEPLALIVMAFLLGYLFNILKGSKNKPEILKRLLYLVIPAVVSMVILGIFLATRSSAIQAISDSVYPGHRVEQSGHYSFKQLMGGYYNIQLQTDARAIHLPPTLNQSEDSNFILIFPFILPAVLWIMLHKRKSKRLVDWQIIILLGLLAVFLIRFFVPFSEFFFNLTQFNRIPQDRLLIGFGMLNVLLILLVIRYLEVSKATVSKPLLRLSTLFTFVVVAAIGFSTRAAYPGYLGSSIKIILISLTIALIVWLLLRKSYVWSMAILALFSFISVMHVNPLYQGLSILTNSPLDTAMHSVDKNSQRWIVSDFANNLENVPAAYGLNSLSGVYAYPQLSLWEPLGTNPATMDVYNRYAHIFFSVQNLNLPNLPIEAYLDPPALDAFRVHVDPCSPLLKDDNVSYILSSIDINSTCLEKVGQVNYPALTLDIYKVTLRF